MDGSNVARARGSRPASYDDLLAVEDSLVRSGYKPRVVVDASLRHRLIPEDAAALEERLFVGDVVQVPKGTSADVWLVSESAHLGALIVTNDRMREWVARYPWLAERLVAFEPGGDVKVPAPG